jgi:uncharacterized protein YeaO (DUF488 family)
MSIRLKHVYEPPAVDDGYRILVDRLWPRGLPEKDAKIDLWLRDIAPTTELRRWFRHDVERWPGFRERYTQQLAEHGELLDLILDIEHHRRMVTLLFAASDREHNQAVVLDEVLKHRVPHVHH